MPPAVAIAGAAIVGGIAGSMKDKSSQQSSSGVNLGQASDLENQGSKMTGEGLSSLQGMVNAGPGQSDVSGAYDQTNSFATMLGDYAKSGGAPGQQDWLQAQEYAKQQFAPQQMQMDQSFEQEKLRANQMAAQLGRPVNDPYIQAQLSKERMNMQNMMGAQQGAFIGQEARNSALSRLGYTSQLTDVKNSLASQAMANRQALLSLGQGVQASERNWRLGTADRWSNTQQESGGGLKGGLTGAIAGAGIGMGMPKMGGQQPQQVPLSSMPSGGYEAPQLQMPVMGQSYQQQGRYGLNSRGY